MTEALLAKRDLSINFDRKPKRKTWQYDPPKKQHAVDYLADTLLRLAETDRESRGHLPKRTDTKPNKKLDRFVQSMRVVLQENVSSTSIKNAEALLMLLPRDLLNDDLEFGTTEDGYATLTWYTLSSTAAISVGESPDIYFSTVNRNGQRMRGCKSFDNSDVVFASIRNA